jgi:DNA repair ATPase RecN
MADPELWHAIHRLAVIIKHMDVDDELGVEMDGLLDMVKNVGKTLTGAGRKIKAWAGDNTLTPDNDFKIHNLKTYKEYVDSLKQYEDDLGKLKGTITSNSASLKDASKAVKAVTKTNNNDRIKLEAEEKRLTRLQKAYENKKKAYESLIDINKEILVRYKESFNEMKDYEYRMAEAESENTEFEQDLRALKHEDEEIALIPPKAP